MHDGHRAGQRRSRLVMVRDDQVHAELLRQVRRRDRGDPAIDGDQQPGARLGQGADRLAVQAVAFVDAVGDVVIDLGPEQRQQLPEDGDAGDAVDVVVAVDGDLLFLLDGLASGAPTAGAIPGIWAGRISSVSFGCRKTLPSRASTIPRLTRICAISGEIFNDLASCSVRSSAGGITHSIFCIPAGEGICLRATHANFPKALSKPHLYQYRPETQGFPRRVIVPRIVAEFGRVGLPAVHGLR